jgi:hypothetical protein
MMAMDKIAMLLWPCLLCACTTQQLYQTGQGWQKQECQRIQDREERGRCEKSAALSYERYKAEAEAAKKPPP